MKLSFAFPTILLCLTLTSQYARASIIFSDNFDSEPVITEQLNYTGFANWNVTIGSVDIISYDVLVVSAPTTGGWTVADGFFVDMDGSTNAAGRIETKNTFNLLPGNYEISFLASGNLRVPDNNTLRVQIGSVYQEDIDFTQLDPRTAYSRTFNVSSPQSVTVIFQGFGGDNVGVFLDDIKLTSVSANPIPEPSTFALALIGLLSLGMIGRRRSSRLRSR